MNIIALDLPGRTESEPILWMFHLVSVFVDFLLENPIIVADPIASSWNVVGRQRIKVASSKSA